MIKTKHILTTGQTPDRLYIPPTIEVVEVEEECALAGGSLDGESGDSNKGEGEDQTRGAKGNNLFFFDNFSEDTNDDNSDY